MRKKNRGKKPVKVYLSPSKILDNTKSRLDEILHTSQETKDVIDLFHSSMREFVELWKHHTGIPDKNKKDEYYTVMSSPEVLREINEENIKTRIAFYEAAIGLGHLDLMKMFAGNINHDITEEEAFYGLKNAILSDPDEEGNRIINGMGSRGINFFDRQKTAVSELYKLSGLKKSFTLELINTEYEPDLAEELCHKMGYKIKPENKFKKHIAQQYMFHEIAKNIVTSKTPKDAYFKNMDLCVRVKQCVSNYYDSLEVRKTLENALGIDKKIKYIMPSVEEISE